MAQVLLAPCASSCFKHWGFAKCFLLFLVVVIAAFSPGVSRPTINVPFAVVIHRLHSDGEARRRRGGVSLLDLQVGLGLGLGVVEQSPSWTSADQRNPWLRVARQSSISRPEIRAGLAFSAVPLAGISPACSKDSAEHYSYWHGMAIDRSFSTPKPKSPLRHSGPGELLQGKRGQRGLNGGLGQVILGHFLQQRGGATLGIDGPQPWRVLSAQASALP